MGQRALPAGESGNKGPAILIVSIITTVLVLLAVGLRLHIRLRITRSFAWEDGLIVTAALVAICGMAFCINVVVSGAGQHIRYLSATQIMGTVKWVVIYELQNLVSATFTKLSIMLFILRIQNSRSIKRVLLVAMVVNVIVNTIGAAIVAFTCIPFERMWNPDIPGKCLGRMALPVITLTQGVVSGLSDVLCTALPYVILWKVQIKTRLKVVICGLMSFGLAATAANVARDVLLGFIGHDDVSYNLWSFLVATILEQNIAIIAACIPTFQPLFKAFVNSLHPTVDNKSTRNSLYPVRQSTAALRRSNYNNLGGLASNHEDERAGVTLEQYPDLKS